MGERDAHIQASAGARHAPRAAALRAARGRGVTASMELPLDVALLVLLAAVLHASWNVLVKVGDDRLLVQATIIGTGSLLCALLLPWSVLPATASWPFIVGSMLIHNVYFFFLLRAYGHGDLSQVYPIARGTSPLVVALLAIPLAGERLALHGLVGVLLVTLGLASLASGGGVPGERRALGYAIGTGLLIASFTLVDGIGVRRAGSPLAFILWMQALEVVPIGIFVALRRRARLATFLAAGGRRGLLGGVLGGVMAAMAYGIVLWAYSRASLAPVAALRETSVVMATLFGALSLGEPFGPRRVIASIVVVVGVALLNV
jgi:drug/metabolite transporter (DMT)-like permease